MSKLIIDSQTRAKLHDLSERLEMCDEDGRVLGVYLPVAGSELYRNVTVPATKAELEQSEQEGARPLADILRELECRP